MLTQAYFERDQDILDCDILSDSTENDSQFHEEIALEEDLELFEKSVSEEIVLNDPVWRLWRLICRNFDNCNNFQCPYSHPKEIYLDFNPKRCDKEYRFHDGICRKYHRISTPLTGSTVLVYGVSVVNSAFIRWKKNCRLNKIF